MGLVIGVAVGAVLGAATYEEPKCTPDAWMCGFMDPGRGGATTIGAATVGILGTVVGFIAGAPSPAERWAPASVRERHPSRLGRRLTPSGR